MAIVYTKELPRERSQSGAHGETYTYTRAFLVRTDSPTEPLPNITNAPGFAWLDDHPDDASVGALSFETSPADDSSLLYYVKVKYGARPVDADSSWSPGGVPGAVEGLMKFPVWSGSSSVTTGPCLEDKDDEMIVNSAGDPLEGMEMEMADAKLSVTNYATTHTNWMTAAATYTNTCNNATWNGGAIDCWKCQGCSAKLATENVGGVTFNFWELTWEFAYRAKSWRLRPWDIGFAERCDSEGVASAGGTSRKAIKGPDGKATARPVALAAGVAKPAGQPPDALSFVIYQRQNFMTAFGEVFTPASGPA